MSSQLEYCCVYSVRLLWNIILLINIDILLRACSVQTMLIQKISFEQMTMDILYWSLAFAQVDMSQSNYERYVHSCSTILLLCEPHQEKVSCTTSMMMLLMLSVNDDRQVGGRKQKNLQNQKCKKLIRINHVIHLVFLPFCSSSVFRRCIDVRIRSTSAMFHNQ